jgi:NADH:ubiquinone oxidoreductase subunit E
MTTREALWICMGSACHQRGVYDLLPHLRSLLSEHQLDSVIEIKGSFCLGPCINGAVLKFRDHLFINITPDNLRGRFELEMIHHLKEAAGGSHR